MRARDRYSDGYRRTSGRCAADGGRSGNEIGPDRRGAGSGGGACPDASHEEPSLQRERDRSGDLRADRVAVGRRRFHRELYPGAKSDEGRSADRAPQRVMPMFAKNKKPFPRLHLWLITLIGVIVPRRLRADWRQEWEAELRYRERLLAEWDRLDRRNKLDLLRRSLSAFWDALSLQPERWEDEMYQDLRFGIRMLLKHKGFTAVAVFTLALGIGANTAVFTLINALLLRPLPVANPHALVAINARAQGTPANISYPMYRDLRASQQVFTDILAT